jgi:hypothetical protein
MSALDNLINVIFGDEDVSGAKKCIGVKRRVKS